MSESNRIKNCFDLFDENKDGVISKEELTNVVRVLGTGKEKNIDETVDNLMEFVDTDKSQTIDFDEFSEKFTEICKEKPKDSELKRIFKLFDKDKNKIIDLNELKAVISNFKKNMSDDDLTEFCREILNKLTNGNEEIGEKEFYSCMQKLI